MDASTVCKSTSLTVKSCAENSEFECMPEEQVKEFVKNYMI